MSETEMTNYSDFYRCLKEEREQIVEKLERPRAHVERREGSPFGKREEEASEASELEKRLALEKKLRVKLAEIEHALEKYETGTYGLCDSCGQPIELTRLEALPQANLCLNCKTCQIRKGGK